MHIFSQFVLFTFCKFHSERTILHLWIKGETQAVAKYSVSSTRPIQWVLAIRWLYITILTCFTGPSRVLYFCFAQTYICRKTKPGSENLLVKNDLIDTSVCVLCANCRKYRGFGSWLMMTWWTMWTYFLCWEIQEMFLFTLNPMPLLAVPPPFGGQGCYLPHLQTQCWWPLSMATIHCLRALRESDENILIRPCRRRSHSSTSFPRKLTVPLADSVSSFLRHFPAVNRWHNLHICWSWRWWLIAEIRKS